PPPHAHADRVRPRAACGRPIHRRIFRPVTEPSRPDDDFRAVPPAAERTRCPRCGATLGRLPADASDPAREMYCGCCGLVVPDAHASAAPR
ncbi:MAG: hypothetical protein ACXWZ7_13105, partial [Gemmatirosa sp.]